MKNKMRVHMIYVFDQKVKSQSLHTMDGHAVKISLFLFLYEEEVRVKDFYRQMTLRDL